MIGLMSEITDEVSFRCDVVFRERKSLVYSHYWPLSIHGCRTIN